MKDEPQCGDAADAQYCPKFWEQHAQIEKFTEAGTRVLAAIKKFVNDCEYAAPELLPERMEELIGIVRRALNTEERDLTGIVLEADTVYEGDVTYGRGRIPEPPGGNDSEVQ
jgi:hypothetical protein